MVHSSLTKEESEKVYTVKENARQFTLPVPPKYAKRNGIGKGSKVRIKSLVQDRQASKGKEYEYYIEDSNKEFVSATYMDFIKALNSIRQQRRREAKARIEEENDLFGTILWSICGFFFCTILVLYLFSLSFEAAVVSSLIGVAIGFIIIEFVQDIRLKEVLGQ